MLCLEHVQCTISSEIYTDQFCYIDLLALTYLQTFFLI